MSDGEDEENLEDRNICERCVGEDYLRADIQGNGADDECSYCGKHARTITIGDLADHVATALEQHYYRTSDEPEGVDYLLAKEGLWEREGEPIVYVISEMAQVDEEPASDVREVLAERAYDFDEAAAGMEGPYDEEAQYVEGPVRDHELQAQWSYFQKGLQTESRFFNRDALATLESIFEGVKDHRAHDGKPVIVDAGPGLQLSALYRARVFQSDDQLGKAIARPDLELGPPPASAAVAGRMNAQGITVFYGATDPAVALAETRPPVGSKVLVGTFEIIRPLKLLDMEALSRVRVSGSVFDPTFLPALEKAKFLESVSHRIARPVLPDDAPFAYLVTQAIAEYLAGRDDPQIDGIIFPSVQSGTEKNVVLFHKASRVAEFDIPRGTEIRAHTVHSTEEGPEPDYRVWEEVPPEDEKKEKTKTPLFDPAIFIASFAPTDNDAREPSLRVVIPSLRVHHVGSVTFSTFDFEVSRHRTEKRTPRF